MILTFNKINYLRIIKLFIKTISLLLLLKSTIIQIKLQVSIKMINSKCINILRRMLKEQLKNKTQFNMGRTQLIHTFKSKNNVQINKSIMKTYQD